ncbi:hypothetical protein BDF19DRAFT_431085 [Syncephalis fuscata]|nr:hypothetical protein BDF19DRAFT_431085 [Syncephalis fuscata]
MRNRMLSILPPSMVSIKSHYNPGSNQESATDMTFINMPNSEQRGTASWQPKPVDNRSYQHEPLDDAISQRIPSIFINDENKQSYAVADARASEIRELKAMMAAQKTQIQEQQAQMETQKNRMEAQMVTQMRQLAMMSNQLAVLEGDTNTNNSAIMLNKPTPDKTCLASTSINQYSKAILSSDISSSLEARVSNIEAFQYRLETFYLSSDLFKDNSFN